MDEGRSAPSASFMVTERPEVGMLPVLADVPYQFWALLASCFAAFLASHRKAAPRDADL